MGGTQKSGSGAAFAWAAFRTAGTPEQLLRPLRGGDHSASQNCIRHGDHGRYAAAEAAVTAGCLGCAVSYATRGANFRFRTIGGQKPQTDLLCKLGSSRRQALILPAWTPSFSGRGIGYGTRYSWVICAFAFVVACRSTSSCRWPSWPSNTPVATGQRLASPVSRYWCSRTHSCGPAIACGGWPNSGLPAVNRTGLEHWKRPTPSPALLSPDRWPSPLHAARCCRSASAVIAGATGPRLVQYAVLGAVIRAGSHLIGVHTVAEAPMRPVRIALAGDTGIGDSLPRSRPTFAAWSNVAMLAAVLAFTVMGAMWSAVFRISQVTSPSPGWRSDAQ